MDSKSAPIVWSLVAVFLCIWPFLAIKFLRLLPIGLALSIWGLSSFGGVVLLVTSLSRRLRHQGRAWTSDRPPSGIAGKRWGVLAPSMILPPALVFCFAFLGYVFFRGEHTALILVSLIICAGLAYAYTSSLQKLVSQRRSLNSRDDNDEFLGMDDSSKHNTSTRASLEALESIAEVLEIPLAKLRSSDRFGYEIGTFSSLDETLDRIGGKLLMRKKKALRKALSIDHVKTVGDYLREWDR